MKNSFSNTIDIKKEFIIEEKIEEIHKDLQEFFGFKLENEPKINYLNSREEIDEYFDRQTEDWVIAFVDKNGNINITSYDKFEDVSKGTHKKEEFFQILKHEFIHKYFYEATGINLPRWLNEGLANYLSEQKKKLLSDEELLNVFNYFNGNDTNRVSVYPIGYFWTKYLIESFGKEKLLYLLTSIKNYQADNLTEEIFKKIFYKVYEFEYSKESFEKILLNKK